MSYMFRQCHSLKHLDLSSFITMHVNNMCHMFGLCSKIENIDLSNLKTGNITNIWI